MRTSWMWNTVLVVAASVLSSVTTALLLKAHPAAAPLEPQQGVAPVPLDAARLERMEELLNRLEILAASSAAWRPPQPRQPAESDFANDERLGELLTRLEERIAGMGARFVDAGGSRALPRGRAVQWQALANLRDHSLRDPEVLRAELTLLTPREVIDRFGPPTRAEECLNCDMWWSYECPGEGGEQIPWLDLHFTGGYVLHSDFDLR